MTGPLYTKIIGYLEGNLRPLLKKIANLFFGYSLKYQQIRALSRAAGGARKPGIIRIFKGFGLKKLSWTA